MRVPGIIEGNVLLCGFVDARDGLSDNPSIFDFRAVSWSGQLPGVPEMQFKRL